MNKTVSELAQRWLTRNPDGLSERETAVLQSAIDRRTISRDTSLANASFGQRLADAIARVGGSWSFIIAFLAFLGVWALLNAWLLGREAFDPYPFIFLNLVLSMVAAIQAPVIMMSQNRQTERDRVDAGHDYEVNLKAEIEIMALHEKLDEMRHMEIVLIRDQVSDLREAIARIEARLFEGAGKIPAEKPAQ